MGEFQFWQSPIIDMNMKTMLPMAESDARQTLKKAILVRVLVCFTLMLKRAEPKMLI